LRYLCEPSDGDYHCEITPSSGRAASKPVGLASGAIDYPKHGGRIAPIGGYGTDGATSFRAG
jgi:hypothetical protein